MYHPRIRIRYANSILKTFTITFALSILCVISFASFASANLVAPKTKCHNQTNFKANASKQIKAMFCMTNYARRKKGLRRLRFNSKLKRSSKKKSANIMRCQQFSHTACGRKFEFWILKYKYPRRCYWIGENIAWGVGRIGSVRDIFIAWMRSPGHRSAILNRKYRDFGVSFQRGTFKGHAGSKIWTQHFGYNC